MPVVINGSTGISGTDGSAATPAVQGTDTNTGMFFPAADQIAFAEGGTEAMRLDAVGNVGIGTSSPGAKLDVSGASNTAVARIISTDSTRCDLRFQTSGSNSGLYFGNSTTFDLGRLFYDNAGNNMVFVTNSTERARITSGGQFLVGTSNTYATMRVLIEGPDTPLALRHSTAGAGNFWRVGPDGSGNNLVVYNQNGNGVYIINNGTSWLSSSDERLKTDLAPMENAAQKVLTLRAVTGRFKTDEPGVSRAFLIAQDVQAVLPEAVSVKDDEQGTLGLSYTDVIPLLTAALKEALTKIDALEARIATLEAR